MYSLDTNIFIDWWERRYPPDVFPSVRKRFESVVGTKLFAPQRVHDEIQRVGSPDLRVWFGNNSILVVPHDVAIQTEAASIQSNFPGLIDQTSNYDEADRWVIALARLKGFVVVTHETRAASKKHPPRTHYIPDVCDALGIDCIDLIELMRREKWKF